MKRQQSILSFLHHKPSTDKPPSNPNAPRGNPTDDVTGTDTPPEKEQRSFFAAGETKEIGGGSMFNSIKHKFMRPNTVQKPTDRNTLDGGHSSINSTSNKSNLSNGRDKESSLSGFPRMQNVIDLDETAGEGDKRHPLLVDSEGDITGPETPGTRPLVPRLKRVQEDGFNFGSATTHSSIDNTKRVRFSHDLSAEGKKDGVASEISKRVTFSLDSPIEKKKPELLSDNSKRVKFSHDLSAEGKKDGVASEISKRVTFSLDSPAENKKLELSSDNSKRAKFSYDLPAEIKKPEPASDNIKRSKFFHNLSADIKKPELASDNSKRSKYFNDLPAEIKKEELASDMGSKFDWLHPSKIKDANGRRPGNPFYDKRTLHIPPDVLRKMSASQKQYWSVKSEYMDVLIFFKVGKFYELYEVDAEIGHKELDWKMTMSGVGKCRQVGIPESGIDDAVEKLLARGYKVGRVEQLETSEQAKSRGGTAVIQRKLVNVLTPSTLIHGNIGPQAVHLLALKEGMSGLDDGTTAYGFAFVDCAALQFWVGSVTDDASCAALGALLMQVSPAEVIFDSQGLSKEAQKALNKYSLIGSVATQMTPTQPATDFVDSFEVHNFIKMKGYFKGSSNVWDRALDGVVHQEIALCALGGLTNHLSRLKLDDALLNGSILPYEVYRGCLRMDGQTMANLEIFSNSEDGGTSGTLYKYLDNCLTLSGKRLLRKWLCHPLKDIEEINQRLNVVEELMGHAEIMQLIAQHLKKLPDLERFLGQIKASFNSTALLLLPLIGSKILKQRVKAFGFLVKGLRVGMHLLMLLQKEDNVFSLLSKLFTLPMLSGSDGLDKFLTQFEAAVDSDFPNYQAHELKDSDAELLSILIELFMEKANEWFQVIFALNCIDVLRSFATNANFSCMAMSRPVIIPRSTSDFSQGSKGPSLHMKGLCHPYALGESGGTPVPNDLCLGDNEFGYNPRTLLLTGPNMGGKSTILRATCLAVILAQLGSYVPCEMCVLSPVDTIFTRLGATDRIMTGESTFLIECTETASVLQNASQDSLVILDELGRGTSTFDGYAIAYAVFRHLVEKVNCRLLFATHYHPLTKEFAAHPHVTLQHMACAFKSISGTSQSTSQQLVFLYRLTNGACPESYGMQVALMAGIPQKVVEAATKAAEVMKTKIGVSFRSSEQRSEFSTLHEEWLKSVLAMSRVDDHKLEGVDEDDVFDELFCLWHELKCSNKKLM